MMRKAALFLCILSALLLSVNNVSDAAVVQQYYKTKSQEAYCNMMGCSPQEFKFESCGSNILTIDAIGIAPGILKPGLEFSLYAGGFLSEAVGEGAYANVVVLVEQFTIFKKTFDICSELKNKDGNDIQCPIPQGQIKVSQKFTVPDRIPLGRYVLLVDAFTADNRSIGCFNAHFSLDSNDFQNNNNVVDNIVKNYYYK